MLEEEVVEAPGEAGPRKKLKRQVMAEAEADAGEAEGARPFTRLMRKDWARGELKSNKVLEYAFAATAQGMQGAGKLSQTPNPQNAYRQLRSALGWPEGAPELKWLEFKTTDGRDKVHPVICPIELVETMLERHPKEFQEHITGDPKDIRKCWEGLGESVVRTSLGANLDMDTIVGVGIHGDGAPTTKQEGLLTLAWNGTTGKGSTRQTRNIYTVIPQSMEKDGTLLACWDYLAWSFNALCEGRIPERDHRGVRHPNRGRKLANGVDVCRRASARGLGVLRLGVKASPLGQCPIHVLAV